ncbi:hypothetical protein RI367_000738 [Sorochytrium milnesiophthora]
MPKARSVRVSRGAPGVRSAGERNTASAQDTVGLATQEDKKSKRMARRDAFLQKLHQPRPAVAPSASKDKKKKKSSGFTLHTLPGDLKDALASVAVRDQAKAVVKSKQQEAKAERRKMNEERTTSRRGRDRKLATEAERFQQVLQHSAFREDPLQTLQLHLSNTLGRG